MIANLIQLTYISPLPKTSLAIMINPRLTISSGTSVISITLLAMAYNLDDQLIHIIRYKRRPHSKVTLIPGSPAVHERPIRSNKDPSYHYFRSERSGH